MSESYKALTRKYRPRSFDDVVSQEHVINTLRNAIQSERISHAYLFCGPRGVGKTTMARVVARMINGVSLDVDGEELGRTLDIIEIDAASNSGVDDVRLLRDGVRVPPQKGTYKVYIIDEVHMLSKQAFNALLKTLEEPPAYIKFIFATTEPHKVLPTVLSRCQRFDFRRITVSEIVARLRYICGEESITIDDSSLHVIGRKADGALRDALSIMDQAIAFCGNIITYEALLRALNVVSQERLFDMISCVRDRDTRRAMTIVDELLLEGHDIQEFLIALTEHLRNMYLAKDAANQRLIEATDEERRRLTESAADFSEDDLLRMLHMTSEAQFKVREAQQPRIQLEITVLKLVTMERSKGLQQLLAEISELKKKLYEPGITPDSAPLSAKTGSAEVRTSPAEVDSSKKPAVVQRSAVNGKATGGGAGTATTSDGGKGKQPAANGSRPQSPVVATDTGKAASAIFGSPSIRKTAQVPIMAKADAPAPASWTPDPVLTPGLSDEENGAEVIQDPAQAALFSIPIAAPIQPSVAPRSAESAVATFDNAFESTSKSAIDSASELPAESPSELAAELTSETAGELPSEDTASAIVLEMQHITTAWPLIMDQVRSDCPQLVYFAVNRTRPLSVEGSQILLECQDELTAQLIAQHKNVLEGSFARIFGPDVELRTQIRKPDPRQSEANDPYAQFKQMLKQDPKLQQLVDILGAELEY